MENKNEVIDITNNLKVEFSEYIRSTFDIKDEVYNELFFKELADNEHSLYKGPYISSSLAFKQDRSINELIKGNLLEEKMSMLKTWDEENKKYVDYNLDRPLYWHQVESLKRISNGNNVVVTTGTGSGKTESFLIPVINDILKDIRMGNTEKGIRAIFLFPMNALVNDQMQRVREFLSSYPEVKYAIFNGDTKENDYKGEEKKLLEEELDGMPWPSNELYTREDIRNEKPHILFTNYSMLEYLLIRPDDRNLISSDTMKHWKFMILDEAHTYKGALGIEISMLLSRLCGIANRTPQFILTSATLGRGKEDIEEIKRFANKLTRATFNDEDIIFSKRILLDYKNMNYSVDPIDYVSLDNAKTNDEIRNICSKYIDCSDYDSDNSLLYNLLFNDRNVFEFFRVTKDGCLLWDLEDNLVRYGFDINSLTALMNLLSKTETSDKNGLKLFTIRYHFFLKAPDGCYVTLGKNKKLKLTKSNYIGDKRAFKIGICQSCRTPFIMGIIDKNTQTLINDDEIDIDEVYDVDDSRANELKYFIVKDNLSDVEINNILNDDSANKEYKICSKCGYIVESSEEVGCNCGDTYIVDLIGIHEEKNNNGKDKDVAFNNLNCCPVCDYKSKGNGVVLGFHIGKDRATVLLAQMLYRFLPQKYKYETVKTIFGDKIVKKNIKKQFLTFSDSRQQGAFFSKFFNETNSRILNKALIWDIISKNNHNVMSFDALRIALAQRFEEYDIFTYENDATKANKNSWVAALWDLMLIDGKNSAEGVGLFGFRLRLPEDYYDDANIEAALKQQGYDLSAEEFRELTKIALEVFRIVPAIDYVSFAEPKEQKELLGYRSFDNYVKLQKFPKEEKSYIKSFLPINKTNKLLKYVTKTFGCDDIKGIKLLRDFIWLFADNSKILTYYPKEDAAKISAFLYEIYSYKNTKFYKCDKCGKVTTYNIRNHCVEGDCNGHLEIVDPDEHFKNNYYRKEFLNRPIEEVVCEEHTAQIGAKDARKKQNLFKRKEINVLSSSTTFEMGINLGDLTTVFMRNVPPTPANYIQRAGRAGRSKDTQAFVLTFCSTSSHDYTYYENPLTMISGVVKTPYFELDNDKIILRHIMASCFSYFFAEDEQRFSSIDNFINNEHHNFWKYINSKPKNLSLYIDNYVLPNNVRDHYSDFKWLNYVNDGELTNMVNALNNLIEQYNIAINNEKDIKQRSRYENELKKLKGKNTLISYFSRYGVIPSYGFPVDNVNLKIYDIKRGKFNDDYDLNRDLSVAISEYAPESEIIVDGKKITSQYLELPKSGTLTEDYITICDNCGLAAHSPVKFSKGDTCKSCHAPLKVGTANVKNVIHPIGFIAAQTPKTTRRIKPARTYAGETLYIGDGEEQFTKLNINNVVELQSFKNDSLFTKNEFDFYFCDHCGYAIVNKERDLSPNKPMNKDHNDHKGSKCGNRDLRKVTLGHQFKTDVVRIKFNNSKRVSDKEAALSTLYAMLEGIANYYIIDRDDIGGLLVRSSDLQGYDFILYDTVSGGAGNVKRIINQKEFIGVLNEAYKKVDQSCCSEDLSCYNCLRNFRNQKYHTSLKRGKAKGIIKELLKELNNKNEKYKIVSSSLINSIEEFKSIVENWYSDDEFLEERLLSIHKEMKIDQNIIRPSHSGVEFVSISNNSSYFADFYWKMQNIILFTQFNVENYKYMKDNSSYKCYLLDEEFSLSDFVNSIKGD